MSASVRVTEALEALTFAATGASLTSSSSQMREKMTPPALSGTHFTCFACTKSRNSGTQVQTLTLWAAPDTHAGVKNRT